MIEEFIAELVSSVASRPRLIFHMVFATLIAVILESFGLSLPFYLARIFNLVLEPGLGYVFFDLVVALLFVVIYLVCAKYFHDLISRGLSYSFESLELKNSFDYIDHFRRTCFVDDVKERGLSRELIAMMAFSWVSFISYYLAILFSVYTVDEILVFIGIPFLSTLSSGSLNFLAITSLILLGIVLAFFSEFQLASAPKTNKDGSIFEEWFSDIIKKYLMENCVGKRGFRILYVFMPLTPSFAPPYLRVLTITLQRDVVIARLKKNNRGRRLRDRRSLEVYRMHK